MFAKSAAWYDAMYAWKDYPREAERLRAFIERRARLPVATLLDVACGTAQQLPYLKTVYAVEGLDLDAEMLSLARGRCPDVVFHRADMVEFDLHRQYDVVACLFASIAYAKTRPRLRQAIASMRRHVRPGGLVIVEPFIRPERFEPGRVSATFVDRPDLKIARIHLSTVENGIAILPFHYLVGTPDRVQYFRERHELALFSHDEYLAAFRRAWTSCTTRKASWAGTLHRDPRSGCDANHIRGVNAFISAAARRRLEWGQFKRKEETTMRVILTALILGISVGAVAAPALADDSGRDMPFLAAADRDTPQISVGVVAGSDDQPATQERYEKN